MVNYHHYINNNAFLKETRMRIVAGSAKGRILKSPCGRKLRPTSVKVKTAFFNIVGDSIGDAGFLDLFAGTGNIGLEALSRGAERAVFVEKDKHTIQTLRQNIFRTDMQEFATVLAYDIFKALKVLERKSGKFDVVYIDPPYKYQGIAKILDTLYSKNLVNNGGIIVVERDKRAAEEEAWLKKIPLLFWKRKVYGDTALVFLKVKNKRS